MAVVTREEQDLIQACQRGEAHAFEELYSLHAQPVFAFLLGMLGNRDQAEDELQEVFVSFAGRINQLESGCNIRAYLLTSARNRVYNLSRSKRREADFNRNYELLVRRRKPELPNGLTLVELDEQRKMLNQALAELPEVQREVVLLHTQSGLAFREIAEVVERPQGTVATQYRSGVQNLREKLTRA